MNSVLVVFLIGFGLCALTIIADVFIKNASLQNAFSGWKMLIIGAVLYGITAIGWFFVMRKMKLSTLGVLYGVGCLVLLTLVSVFVYKEKINLMEIIGIVLAITSVLILYRFA